MFTKELQITAIPLKSQMSAVTFHSLFPFHEYKQREKIRKIKMQERGSVSAKNVIATYEIFILGKFCIRCHKVK